MAGGVLQDVWVQRVLGVAVTRGQVGAEPPVGVVAYRKLLLRWRKAQGDLAANLNTVGTTLLALPEIQADSRLADIRKAVGMLPRLVPTFGGELEDVLDAGLNATEPDQRAALARRAVAAIDVYRKQLAGAAGLRKLDRLATDDLGVGAKLHETLDGVLLELRQRLAG